jgi:hypothetical protein
VDDKSAGDFSEITILPDGRLYVFGLTRPVLELLANMPTQETHWKELAATLSTPTAPADAAGDDL